VWKRNIPKKEFLILTFLIVAPLASRVQKADDYGGDLEL
jgi:hypothetical protein